jgi:recombination protein RecA
MAQRKQPQATKHPQVRRGADWQRRARPANAPRWTLDETSGRVCELSGQGATARLSAALKTVREAQARGEPVAWITARTSTFFPPDAATCGIDLAALPVVFVGGAQEALRSAERLARSGGFGLLVVDLSDLGERVPAALQSRLAGLAQGHELAVICLTEKPADAASIGPLVNLRAQAVRRDHGQGGFGCRVEAVKDKRRAKTWSDEDVRRGPVGLR